MVPNREVTFLLPYLCKLSLDLRTMLYRNIERHLPCCKLKVIFKLRVNLKHCFELKIHLRKKFAPEQFIVLLLLCYLYNNCKVAYSWKAFHYFSTRATEHMGISILAGSRLKTVSQSALFDHLLQYNATMNFDDVNILNGEFVNVNETWKTFFKQDDKIVSIGTLWLRWRFYFQYHMIVRFFLLIYNRKFIVCTDRVRRCFKCYVKEKKMWFWKRSCRKQSKLSWLEINGFVKWLFYETNLKSN